MYGRIIEGALRNALAGILSNNARTFHERLNGREYLICLITYGIHLYKLPLSAEVSNTQFILLQQVDP